MRKFLKGIGFDSLFGSPRISPLGVKRFTCSVHYILHFRMCIASSAGQYRLEKKAFYHSKLLSTGNLNHKMFPWRENFVPISDCLGNSHFRNAHLIHSKNGIVGNSTTDGFVYHTRKNNDRDCTTSRVNEDATRWFWMRCRTWWSCLQQTTRQCTTCVRFRAEADTFICAQLLWTYCIGCTWKTNSRQTSTPLGC